MTKFSVYSSAALLPLIFAVAAPAVAQTNDDGEIVVTARRTAETLQEVPASVSAFTAEALDRVGATDATGLQGAVPNLNIVQGRGSGNATNIFIRGVGQPDALQTFDPAVGFYVDDVYYSRIRGTQLELFDIERIEVLRGPQGTLYGKNTIGGAVKIVTHRPGQTPRAAATLAFGDYGQLEGRLSASGPITDTFAVGAAVMLAEREGYVTNPVTGEEYNDRNVGAARGQIAWDLTPTVSLDVSLDYTQERNALITGQALNTLTTLVGGLPILTVPVPTPEYNFTVQTTPGLPNRQELTHWGGAATLNFDLSPGWTMRSITAFRSLNYDDFIDIDATQFELGDVFVGVRQDQISQELQFLYEGDRWSFVGGAYYIDEDIVSEQIAFADDLIGPLLGNPTFTRTISDNLETQSWAVFANATYALTDRLNVSVGARYTEEEKDYFRTTSTFSSFALFTANPAFAFQVVDTWEDFSPMASIDFTVTDDLLLYARAARGFKSGGFNGRANNPGEQAPYNPEIVTSFEVGAKSDWFNDMLRANLAVFYNDYEDFQARVSSTVIDPGTGLPSPELTVINAGQLEIFGAELELALTPTEGLLFDAQIGYLDAEYGEFRDDRFTAFGGDRSFQEPAFSPDLTARFGAQYTYELPVGGAITAGAQARYRGEHALAVDNTISNTNTRIEGLFQDSYWIYDARLVWESDDGGFHAGVYGRNLGDEVYKTDGQEFSSVASIRTVYYGAPRTWTVQLGWRY